MVRAVTEDDTGLKVLYEPSANDGSTSTPADIIDIVAIHGIGAHPDDTWCKNVGTDDEGWPRYVNWLSDPAMLPSAVPNARIMRYGYMSRWFGDEAIRQNVNTVADAERFPDEWPNIYHAAAGIIFLGTPFRGAPGLSQTEMIRAAEVLYKDTVQGEVLRILDPDDELLLETVHLFEKVRTSSQNGTRLACFFELRPCNSFAVSESSGCLDAAQKIGLQRTHFDMNKFGKPSEEEYQTVRDVIEEMVEAAPRLLLARSQYSGEHKVAFSLKGVPLANRFVGRDAEMQRLEDYFHPRIPSSARRKVFVVHGLGGIGKTQLVIEFARKHRSRYSAVFWLDGSSKDRLKQSFVDVAYRLPRDQLTADAAEALKHSDIDVDVVVGGVLQWLSLPSNQHWLLIIDNVDRDHLNKGKDPQAYDVKEFFPLHSQKST
ncbi:hypothetical protein H2199_005553 [Coniosporium tulheliwenetii]|uniref:Uncharacterized protein n=1 Tax=Coniosporium tulheliwenetii TaxID=3383036 RepID=A0ACC2Z004_9PEZI|nr:hypothetical protein H2199_005553 [Cladosporium sp. JES 115]